MAFLADTHLALWLIDGSPKLSDRARDLLLDAGNVWYLSVVSAWEVMLKHHSHPRQMLIDAPTFLRDCEAAGFRLLQLKEEHIVCASGLVAIEGHKDPFDRMLLAQAIGENLDFVTHDEAIARYRNGNIVLV